MKSKTRCWLMGIILIAASHAPLHAEEPAKGRDEFDMIGLVRKLKGRVVDHTHNHGLDNRIWSRSLHDWRDLYIYMPPGFDTNQCYPIIYFLHPFALDERTFLHVIPEIDAAIACGKFPPVVIVAPDGSVDGAGCLARPGSFFLNSNAGPYEDYLLQDVWDFVCARYPIRPEREAHVFAGVSMGGFAAFNLGIRHRYCFGTAIGLLPPLNVRWCDAEGNPRAKFDPRNWGWRKDFSDPQEVLATYAGAIKIRMGQVVGPVFGNDDEALLNLSNNNPLELAMKTGLCNNDLSMFIGYAGRDQFNIDAQVESFLYYAKCRNISVAVAFEPDGHHDMHTSMKFVPAVLRWLGPQLAPYAPTYQPPPKAHHPWHWSEPD